MRGHWSPQGRPDPPGPATGLPSAEAARPTLHLNPRTSFSGSPRRRRPSRGLCEAPRKLFFLSSIDHWWCRGCGAMELWHAGKKRKKKENNYKELKMIWGKIFPAFTLFFEDVLLLLSLTTSI